MKRGTQPGLLAYLDGVPVGWCRIGPREMFDRLEHSATLRRVDDERVWSVVCFYVHPTAKRQGVARALLAGAEQLAARHGARLVEAYPVGPKQINLDAYTGYAPMYAAAGYDVVLYGFDLGGYQGDFTIEGVEVFDGIPFPFLTPSVTALPR